MNEKTEKKPEEVIDSACIRSWVEAPRWAGAKSVIEGIAWDLCLDCETQVSKGWINEIVRYKVRGNPGDLKRFAEAIRVRLR